MFNTRRKQRRKALELLVRFTMFQSVQAMAYHMTSGRGERERIIYFIFFANSAHKCFKNLATQVEIEEAIFAQIFGSGGLLESMGVNRSDVDIANRIGGEQHPCVTQILRASNVALKDFDENGGEYYKNALAGLITDKDLLQSYE